MERRSPTRNLFDPNGLSVVEPDSAFERDLAISLQGTAEEEGNNTISLTDE
jgi:hypothetical protein